ncbi:MAG TPA: hypothetical protein PK176_14580, partial [Acidobacteriota bacterium]|nr:hypothetical protein [Acidobacteriota bacterium]HQM64533.1 hypothetical protein [Acidobacteriota bacterium]
MGRGGIHFSSVIGQFSFVIGYFGLLVIGDCVSWLFGFELDYAGIRDRLCKKGSAKRKGHGISRV